MYSLVHALEDEDENVRRAVNEALKKIGGNQNTAL
jgi:HEAT repeat protein